MSNSDKGKVVALSGDHGLGPRSQPKTPVISEGATLRTAGMPAKEAPIVPESAITLKSRTNWNSMPPPPPRPAKKVLDEDTYSSALEKIIQRDFFPDLPELEKKLAWLEALESEDGSAIRALQNENARRPSTMRRDFETPLVHPADGEGGGSQAAHDPREERGGKFEGIRTDVSLDKFLSNYTSEDNVSFERVYEASKSKLRQQREWMNEKAKQLEEKNRELYLLKEKGEAPADSTGQNATWRYTAQSHLMWYPDGPSHAKDGYANRGPPKQVKAANTRMPKEDEAAKRKAMRQQTPGSTVSESPRVGGYRYVRTPSPTPGDGGESPMITWGEIESTPVLLHNEDEGPKFTIKNTPRREQLSHNLADKATKNRNSKAGRVAASPYARPAGTPLFRAGATPVRDSPALQLLRKNMGMKAGHSTEFGDALRSTYGGGTGLRATPGRMSTIRSTPQARTVSQTPKSKSGKSSITDGLLKI